MNERELGRRLGSCMRDSGDLSSLVFVVLAQNEMVDDVTISEWAEHFIVWDEHWRGKRGDIARDEGKLYRSIHDVTDAGQNTKPSATPSMWTPIGDPGDEWPEWSQPLGAHDAYAKGAKVTHGGKRWVSDVDGNVWVPGAYGWTEQT